MRALLVSFGTRGDVQPMLVLAKELRSRGHEVTLCAPKLFEEWVTRGGVHYVALGIDPRELLEASKSLSRMRALFLSDVQRQFEVLSEQAENADLIVSGSVVLAAQSIAEKRRIPFVSAVYCPATYPSAEHAFPPLGARKLPRWARKLSWMLGTSVYGWTTLPAINGHRKKLELEKDTSPLRHMFGDDSLLASEPQFGAAPADAPVPIEQTGAWLQESEPLPSELEDFLSAGPAPVYLGFGSNPDEKTDETSTLLLEGVARAGVRAVIAGVAPKGRPVPGSVLFVKEASHPALFPRCLLVVHHGGAGTTHAAAIAGVPQWVVAGRSDQFFWGQQVTELGLGPAPITRKRLTAEGLVKAIQSSEAHQPRCAAFAGTLRRDGVQLAADALERRVLARAGEPSLRTAAH